MLLLEFRSDYHSSSLTDLFIDVGETLNPFFETVIDCRCTGEKGIGRSGKLLHFKGSVFHRGEHCHFRLYRSVETGHVGDSVGEFFVFSCHWWHWPAESFRRTTYPFAVFLRRAWSP